jgi:hypothetical protein
MELPEVLSNDAIQRLLQSAPNCRPAFRNCAFTSRPITPA